MRVNIKPEIVDEKTIKLSINAEKMDQPILGFSFKLISKNGHEFIKYLPGKFLEQGGTPVYMVEGNGGVVTFGEVLLEKDKLPKGSGEIAVIYFKRNGDVGDFIFQDGIVSGFNLDRKDLSHVEWVDYIAEKVTESEAGSLKVESFNAVNSVELSYREIMFLGMALVFFVVALIIYLKPNNKG